MWKLSVVKGNYIEPKSELSMDGQWRFRQDVSSFQRLQCLRSQRTSAAFLVSKTIFVESESLSLLESPLNILLTVISDILQRHLHDGRIQEGW